MQVITVVGNRPSKHGNIPCTTKLTGNRKSIGIFRVSYNNPHPCWEPAGRVGVSVLEFDALKMHRNNKIVVG